jgi:hypothetical protein
MQKRYVVVNAECSYHDIDGLANRHSPLSKEAIVLGTLRNE